KYIEVDIYGKCGNLSCPRSAGSECESLLGKSYKFYLSFENSLCLDYVTEKVFQRLATRSHVIPVVRGGFNYTKYLPPGWFVNAADFPNARELAVYLKGLGNDPQKYAAMLKEKDKLVTLGYKNDYCDFCEKLHTDQRTKIISDIKEWSHKATCYSP
ncbi:alpha-(1 3)-fucosyltransferase C, partial [Biomphalaria glabrata]